MWKRLGRIVAAPVTLPVRLAKTGLEKGQRKIMQLILLAVIRNGLKVAGMAGLFSDSQVNEYAGALSLVLGLTWTAFNTWREHQKTAQ
jgi:hypothetical protein